MAPAVNLGYIEKMERFPIPLQPKPLALYSRRLILRDFRDGDWRAVHDFRSDPEVARNMDFTPNDEAESREWLETAIFHNRLLPRQVFNLAIVLQETRALIGWIGAGRPRYQSGPGVYEIGYCITRRYWGRGYMTEAAGRLLQFAFHNLGARRVQADCLPTNAASQRVLQKLGMVCEGRFYDATPSTAEDACLRYTITAEGWERQRGSRAADQGGR